MIGIEFLTRGVSGLEFMEFQNKDFFKALSSQLEQQITEAGILKDNGFDEVKGIIANYTGFENIKIECTDEGNLCVNTGYFSPHHVMNNRGVDDLLSPTKSTLYEWFKQNKAKVFKGSVDYSTGKVDGSFKTIPVEMQINKDLNVTFPKDKIEKFGVPIHEVLAGAITHELGHVFSGCMMLATTASDNLLAKLALRYYKESYRVEDRVVVLKDTAALLEIDTPKQTELQQLAQSPTEDTFFIYYNKLLTQRNTKRALSVGAAVMSSEVVADMYAIRMGCDKGVVAAVSILTDIGVVRTVTDSLLMALLYTAFLLFIPYTPVGFIMTFFGLSFILSYFSRGFSGTYNADHRRFEDVVRQLIGKLKEDKTANAKERNELIGQLEQLLVVNKELKPWYENSFVRRFVGWLFNGGDFKLQEIDHYTNVLANHEINVLSHQLKSLS